MKTCPKCGVENIQTAASCYRCAAPLEGPDSLLGVRADMPLSDKLPPTVIISGQESHPQHGPSSEYGGHIICPYCEAGNEPDWLFCQECGKRLPKAQAAATDQPAQRAEAVSPEEPRVADRAAFEQRPPQSFETRVGEIEDVRRLRQQVQKVETSEQPEIDTHPVSPVGTSPQSVPKGKTTNVVCTNCGAIQPTTGFFCTSCGAKMSSMAMKRVMEREGLKAVPSLKLITEGGEEGETYTLDRAKVTVGRSRADITFPHDGFMSGLHARIVERGGHYYLVDENSRNGTFIQINGEIELKPGDTIIIGKQIFRFEKR